MKADELMIGDLFKVNGYVTRVKDIVHLDKEGYYVVGCTTLKNRYIPMCYEPIPLTSELLEEKGFERVPQPGCSNPYHWMLEKYEEESEGLLYRIKAYKTPFRGMYVSIDNHADCETINFGKQIEHVHELQHAFRLCDIGIDL